MSIQKIFCCAVCLVWSVSGLSSHIMINTSDLTINSPTDGFCNLKEAIDAANNNLSSGAVMGECIAGESHPVMDIIEFDVAILPVYFATFESYVITESLHIKGPASELVSFGGIAFNRVFEFLNLVSDAQFIISDVTFADIAIRLPFNDYGGAVLGKHIAGAELTIERVHFLRNNAERGGGAIGLIGGNNNTTVIRDCYFYGNFVRANEQTVAGGGAVFIGGSQNVTVENSTFESNTATNLPGNHPLDDAAGGAILVRATGAAFTSTLVISQSTFSANIADGVGGAVAMGGPGYPSESSDVTIKHSTLIANQADFNNDQTSNDTGGGGIYNSSSNGVSLFNNIIASNTDLSQSSAPEVAGGVISFGYNLIGNNLNATLPFPTGQPNINNDFVGEPPQTILPFVAPLDDNGGPTPTYRLLPNSLAIDQGKCNVLISDQRHQQNDQTSLRTIDQAGVNNFLTGCDIGAYELGAVSENPNPTATDDAYTLLEGESLMVSANNGLLANDIDNDDLVITSAGSFNSSASSSEGPVELWADGVFTFETTDMDANGTTSFTYTVSDLYNQDEGLVELIITPVNDAPFYQTNQSQITAILGHIINMPGWAFDISAGPVNEASQNLVFIVDAIAVSPGFFVQIPTINPVSGDLSFELAATATGTAEMNITLQDDGGTDDGGENSYTTTLFIHASDIIYTNGFESQQ